jgi:hypothetical protein
MIDWVNLAINALWILGCSVALAAISYASWSASMQEIKFTQALKSTGIRLALHAGGMLFCAGLAASARSVIETILWVLLGIGILVHQIWGSPGSLSENSDGQ